MRECEIRILRAGPLTTIQDLGRPGWLSAGISASGPMDRESFERAGRWLGASGLAGVEFTRNGLSLEVLKGGASVAADGGDFQVRLNGRARRYPFQVHLGPDDFLEILPGRWGNYGYLRFAGHLRVDATLDSYSYNSIASLGGLDGLPLRPGRTLILGPLSGGVSVTEPVAAPPVARPVRFIWGLHADLLPVDRRQRFLAASFAVSDKLDRMGVQLTDPDGVFSGWTGLGLASEPVVPGDIQIMGDGTPVVLMADHQPTGGYPRIATIISADLGRFAQMRSGSELRFEPVSVDHAHAILQGAA